MKDDEINSVDFENVPNNLLSLAITINSYNNNNISKKSICQII